MNPQDALIRWRRPWGQEAEQGLGCSLGGTDAARDAELGFLYNRRYGAKRNVRPDQRAAADRRIRP